MMRIKDNILRDNGLEIIIVDEIYNFQNLEKEECYIGNKNDIYFDLFL